MAAVIVGQDQLLQKATDVFKSAFGAEPKVAGIAPGRVNLIGEHTDYNEGFVFPMALPMVTIVLGRKTDTDLCEILTLNEMSDKPWRTKFNVPTGNELLEAGTPKWANYVKGVYQFFDGPKVGFQAVIISSVPLGSGLSSSAALEVSTFTFLEGITGHKTNRKTKALLCQKAEHKFASVPCGLMDQVISIYGEADSATLIDCRSLEVRSVRVPASNYVFLIVNSNVRHELSSSEYSVRRKTCEEVSAALGKSSLRDATLPELEALRSKNQLTEVQYRRARHVITENARTEAAAKSLKAGDLEWFGSLMNESHESLRTDYEVSCVELDTIVNSARQVSGVLGSRMTGGGFGGCTITLVEKYAVDNVISTIRQTYHKTADYYVVTPSEGATIVCL